jgi:glyoxylase-like metal-dependent hydrolase (beta-lactamase superfamily II)
MLSKINFMMDHEFTEPLPIWVWVIEHTEGVFLVDTGENAHVNDKGYFKKEGMVLNWMNTTQFKFQVEPSEEIGAQLSNLNLLPDDVDQVVLTHLHLDHTDGLQYFHNSKVLVHEYEWKHPSFALPSLYPDWFVPELVQLQDIKNSIFSKGYSLTEANDLILIATPGHTKGHCSVLAVPEDISYLFAGDVTYDQQQLIDEEFAGAHQDFTLAKGTYDTIKKYAAQNRTIHLPSHDSRSSFRLSNNIFLDLQ